MASPLDENSITSEMRPLVKKWVCRHCKQEFHCGKGLGGHIRAHYQNQRKTNYTRRKQSKRTTHVRSSTAPPSHSRNISYHRTKNKMKQNGGGGSDEVIDLSKSLFGFGWKGHRKRGCTCIEAKKIASTVFDDQEDPHDIDGGKDSLMTERLRRYGFNHSAHQITCTRRYMCNTCNVVLPAYHDVLCHVNDDGGSSSLDNANDDNDDEGVVAEQEDEGEYKGADNEENEMGAAQEDVADDGKEEEGEGEGKEQEEDDDEMGAEEEEDSDDEVGAEEEEEGEEEEEKENKEDGDDGTGGAEEEEDEEMEGVNGEVPMEVDEVADEEQQEEVGAETPCMEDDEVADLEKAGNGAKATGKADEAVAVEEGVGAKACAQVDEEVAEACDNNSGSMDQKVSTSDSDPPRRLDFDLNEMPPEED